jgi:hypothetical protein
MIRSGIGLRLATLTVIVGGIGCTRDNPAFGRGELADATSADSAGATSTTGPEQGTTRSDATTRPAEDTANDGTSIPDETSDGSETTDTAGVCPRPAPAPFDVIVEGPDVLSCDTYTWEGAVVSAGHDFVELSGCMLEPVSEIPSCTCPQGVAPRGFTFSGLQVDVADALANARHACVAITISYETKDAMCVVDWVGMRTAPLLDIQHVLAAANREVPGLTQPPIELGAPRCEEPLPCNNDGVFQGPHSLQVEIGGQFTQFSPLQPLVNLPLMVHGVSGTYTLKALHGGVDEVCEPHLGWVAVGNDH